MSTTITDNSTNTFTEWILNGQRGVPMQFPEAGFGGLSDRQGGKPVIAAVNGPAYGGGCEIVLNCDLVVAAECATFALPEVKLGIAAHGGGLPRLIMTMGRQRASEWALTGRKISAKELQDYGFCNAVVKRPSDVVAKALEYARMVADNSPAAVSVTRDGLELGYSGMGVKESTHIFRHRIMKRIHDGADMQEGIRAFLEKRAPRWATPKL